ncbi:uncharacterized protein LOC115295183 [Suricata suricatta]|uniref:uncharacterized protein LOC115295183 n=1 Tax=Suricata suricatta TaxID=37032 RepID=UPI00115528EA|nr:uncharacterized protein LOC115295183 [Suricata suricatta]
MHFEFSNVAILVTLKGSLMCWPHGLLARAESTERDVYSNVIIGLAPLAGSTRSTSTGNPGGLPGRARVFRGPGWRWGPTAGEDGELLCRFGPVPGTSQTVPQKAGLCRLGMYDLEQNVQRGLIMKYLTNSVRSSWLCQRARLPREAGKPKSSLLAIFPGHLGNQHKGVHASKSRETLKGQWVCFLSFPLTTCVVASEFWPDGKRRIHTHRNLYGVPGGDGGVLPSNSGVPRKLRCPAGSQLPCSVLILWYLLVAHMKSRPCSRSPAINNGSCMFKCA